jgi:hypothetical protein
VNHRLQGWVSIQLLSLPAGAFGPKYTATESSVIVFAVFKLAFERDISGLNADDPESECD